MQDTNPDSRAQKSKNGLTDPEGQSPKANKEPTLGDSDSLKDAGGVSPNPATNGGKLFGPKTRGKDSEISTEAPGSEKETPSGEKMRVLLAGTLKKFKEKLNRIPGISRLKALSKIKLKILIPIIVLVLILLLIPVGYYLYLTRIKTPLLEAELGPLFTKAHLLVQGEENLPTPNETLTGASSQESLTLVEGVNLFLSGDFMGADDAFMRLEEMLPEDRRVYPLIAASNLRSLNYSTALEYYEMSAFPPFEDDALSSSVDIGYAIALYNLSRHKEALPYANTGYGKRLMLYGRDAPETLSAAIILAGILVSVEDGILGEEILGEEILGEEILEGTLREYLRAHGPIDPMNLNPLLVDSLNILALSYNLRGSNKNLSSLIYGTYEETDEDHDYEETPLSFGDISESSATTTDAPPMAANAALDYESVLAAYQELTLAFPQSPIRADLLEALIAFNNPNGCYPPEAPGDFEKLFELCLELSNILITTGRIEDGFLITQDLTTWPGIEDHPQRHLIFRDAAFQNFERGNLAGAEQFLRLAIGSLGEKESLTGEEVSFCLLRSITLADNLLAQGKPPLEAEIDLVGAINFLERIVGKKELENYPESPMLFWYLARVLREEGKDREAKVNFDRAIKAAKSAAIAHPEAEGDMERIQSLINSDRSAKKGNFPHFPSSPRIFFPSEKLYAGKYPKLPPPNVMLLELNCLNLIGKLRYFEPRINWALETVKENDPDSSEFLRYWRIKLKYLEMAGDYPRFFEELDNMVQAANFTDPNNQAIFKSSAKSYEARVRLAAGDRDGAAAAYREALLLLNGVDNVEGQKDKIQAELAALEESATNSQTDGSNPNTLNP
ncbi:MAG: hypothetical protein LBE38_05380 [Deltaproteobacteria bacterium]|jgi:hypothetical protein|nr:hypothetical protein [Deltaproteobacteria bacterium]